MKHSHSALSGFGRGGIKLTVLCGMTLFFASCGAFNPAFLSLISPGGGSDFVTIPNPPGHVIVALVNNTEFDEQLVNWLAPQLVLSPEQIRSLRPRIRMRVQITFADGSVQTVEFVEGTRAIVQPGFDAEAFPDLNQNDLSNVVAVCDVALVAAEPGSPVEVFMPVELIGFELVEGTNPGGGTVNTFEERQRIAPSFIDLQVDDVDEDGNVIQSRNVGVRDTVSPVANVLCGSVIAIEMRGVLVAPFLEAASTDPSFDIDDEDTIARIGGRFEFNVSVQ